jgi:uncharacterized membrane protein YphA (DoxX/SURF4 family)
MGGDRRGWQDRYYPPARKAARQFDEVPFAPEKGQSGPEHLPRLGAAAHGVTSGRTHAMALRKIATWTLQILIGLMMTMVGVMKFRDPAWGRRFAEWGYPTGFYMLTGVLESAAGVAVLIPSLASYGALLIMAIMCAAALTGLVHGQLQWVYPPLFYLILSGVIFWLRRADRWR